MRAQKVLGVGAVLGVCLVGAAGASQEPTWPTTITRGELYDHYLTGNEADGAPATTGGVLLAGGGTDQSDAFRWLFARAGGGDIVVLRASGADGYHPFAMKIGGLDSIESFVVKSREASSDTKLLQRLGRAEAIFFAGGDQSKYVTFFKDTPVETMVNAAAARGVPLGGTSAGLAIHLEVLDGLITDSHVVERGRLGRTVAFMARLHQDGWLNANGASPARAARALAIDRETAVLLARDGTATVVGPNTAYFMEAAQPPQQYRTGIPLTYHSIQVYKVTRASTFNFTSWTGTGGQSLTLDVRDGVFRER